MSESAAIPTFEEVDKHIQAADLTEFAPGGRLHLTAGMAPSGGAIPNICAAYKVVRPILLLVSNLPVIPAKWRAAVTAFIGLLDTLCP